jgi:hypothetical protein
MFDALSAKCTVDGDFRIHDLSKIPWKVQSSTQHRRGSLAGRLLVPRSRRFRPRGNDNTTYRHLGTVGQVRTEVARAIHLLHDLE